jgi:hypothetical protein
MVPIIVWVILAWLNTDPASAPEYENSFAIWKIYTKAPPRTLLGGAFTIKPVDLKAQR